MTHILVFDTETTGLPDFKLPADDPSQPRICALAAALFSDEGAAYIDEMYVLIKPDGWTVPAKLTEIHGLTTERLEAEGIPIAEALAQFTALMERAEIIAGYGVSFDLKMLRGEYRRAGLDDHYGKIPDLCVMRAATKPCNLPPTDAMMASGRRTPKTPTLAEAHRILVGKDFEGETHNAMNDVRACASVYMALKGRGETMVPKKRESTKTPKAAKAEGADDTSNSDVF